MIMNEKRFIGINKKITLIFILLTSIIVFVITIILSLVFKEIMSHRMIEVQKVFLAQNQSNLKSLMNSMNQISVNLTTDEKIGEILNKKNMDELEYYNGKIVLRQRFEQYVNAPLANNLTTYFARLYLFECYEVSKYLESKELKYDRQKLSDIYNAKFIIDAQWAQETIQKDGGIHTFILDEEKETVYISRLIKNLHTNISIFNQKIGVMVVGLSMEQFRSSVESLSLTENSKVYIISTQENNKQIIYESKENKTDQRLTLEDLTYELRKMNDEGVIKIKGEEYLAMKNSSYWGWEIISIIPLKDIYFEINHIMVWGELISLMGIIIGGGLITIVCYMTTRPISMLTDIMQNIKTNEDITSYSDEFLRHNDEIKLMYITFNTMMKRIEELIKEGYEEGIRTKEIELVALQAQINPHFIYNALDSINWIALCDGNDDIVEIVSSLASIMRYSIKNPNKKVLFRDEILHVENYIKIQTKQNQYPIKVEFRIDSYYLEVRMPKFLIEPLVENCIIHGFKDTLEGGKIVIDCREQEGKLVISVSDNGVGADIELLNDYLRGEVEELRHSDGFGIRNVNERIKLNYGERYGLTFCTNKENGLVAVLNLPRDK